MNETHSITITARDGTQQTFAAISKNAQKSSKDMVDGAEKAGAAQKKLQDRLTATGAGIGTLVGVTSKLGQANLNEARQIDTLGRAYGEQAGVLEDLASKYQEMGIASDDSVRIAAIAGQSLARNYGLTTQEIAKLVEVSADLNATSFDMYGNQLGLTDVMQRVAGAIRGEGEAAEALGLNMSDSAVATEAAARGFDNYATGATEAEKAQFRYTLVLEQASAAQGAAAEQADSLTGNVNAMKLAVLDQASAFGGMIGPAGEAAAVLGDVALAAPLVGGALGKIAGSAKVASLASTVLGSAWMGPAGIAVGAVAVGAAIWKLIGDHDELGNAATRTAERERFLGTTLADLASQLKEVGLLTEAQSAYDAFEAMTVGAEAAEARVQAVNDDLAEFTNLTLATGQATAQLDGDVISLTDGLGNLIYSFDTVTSNALYLNGAMGDGVITADEMVAAQARVASGFDATGEELKAYSEAFADAMSLAADPRYNGSRIIETINYIIEATRTGALTEEEGTAALRAISTERDKYNLILNESTRAQEQLNRAEIAALTSGGSTVDQINLQAAARKEQQENTISQMEAEHKAAVESERSSAIRAEAARRESAAYMEAGGAYEDFERKRGSNASAVVTPPDYDPSGPQGAAQAQDALGEASARTTERILEETRALEAFGQELLAASSSTAVLNAANTTILGGLDNWTSGIGKTEGALTGLFDAADGWSLMDQNLYENRISQEEYNAALKATTDTQFNNNEAQLDSAAILAKQAPLLAELAWQQGLWVDEVSRMPAEQQLVALAYADSARQAQALSIQEQIAAAAAGDLGEAGFEATEKLIQGAVAADPILKAMLLDMGIIEEGADGTITLTADPNAKSEIDILTESINALIVALGGVPPNTTASVDVDTDAAHASVDGASNHLAAYGGESGTATADVDIDPAQIALTEADGTLVGWDNSSGTATADADINPASIALTEADGNLVAWDNSSGSATAGVNDYASGTLSVIQDYLDRIDGRHVTNTVQTNYVSTGNQDIGFTQMHGGLVGAGAGWDLSSLQPALHGRVMGGNALALVGETGPELVSLPYGSSVTPAGATAARRGRGGGGDIHLHIAHLVVQANDGPQLVGSLRDYAISGARP